LSFPFFFFFSSCKIEQGKGDQQIVYGRHFDHTSQIVSKMTRESIDKLKANFKDDLSEADWKLVVKLKKGKRKGRGKGEREEREVLLMFSLYFACARVSVVFDIV
jgi:hypothetical protein